MADSLGKEVKIKKKPLYRMIYEEIKNKIVGQTYKYGDMLPVERELCSQYGVDRVTVRKALHMLAEDRLIEKRAGMGSFVMPLHHYVNNNKAPSRNILFVMSSNANDIKSNPSALNAELFYAMEEACRLNNCSLFYTVLDENKDLKPV
jgi:DNA-binding FadR family transcriptional regulator